MNCIGHYGNTPCKSTADKFKNREGNIQNIFSNEKALIHLKKEVMERSKNNDIDYILSQALEQTGAGADILDVNVGLPEINEKEMIMLFGETILKILTEEN